MKKTFTILSLIFIFSLSVTPAFADGNDRVANDNEADIYNNFGVMSNTGANWADGSYGGEGGNGGDIRNGYTRMFRPGPGPILLAENDIQTPVMPDLPEGDVENSSTGNGGMGGNASDGGTVATGDAGANLHLENWVNRNLTEIDRCACENNDDGNIRVRNTNRALHVNEGQVAANTGDNEADGSYGGEGGNGGDIKNSGEGDVEESMTGTGGDAGSSALGGLVQTGRSDSMAEVVNRINENVTRINR